MLCVISVSLPLVLNLMGAKKLMAKPPEVFLIFE